MEQVILKYINEQLLFDNEMEEDLDSDTDLLGSGILDSLGMVQLIAFVEKEFMVKVPPEDMVIENFMNVDSVCAYLLSK
ncbi:acyl carrier protein [Hyunsoonleella flava]|uniref:Acyl carrier protein n=1 Tax=Hyunsoonleella flava TaxID=2527939 RepID=A0A4Q9FFK1_9FLAO|nr:acyl carrier protein [Hyunsoonleella flava]TBN04421.1 acyl carrier protein [Hyunsoonleella flava]